MSDDCKQQMLNQINSICDDLSNPPLVHGPDAGERLPDDAVECEGNPQDTIWVSGYERKVPSFRFSDRETHVSGAYAYDEDEDAWTDTNSGEVWTGETDEYWWAEEGDLILGGEELDEVREQSASDYVADALDIEYRVGSDLEYRSAEVTVAVGGPHIAIDTARSVVIGCWGGDRIERGYNDEIGLDDFMEEMFSAMR